MLQATGHVALATTKQGHVGHDTVLPSPISIKSWLKAAPTVDGARPSHCPRCRTPSRPMGGGLTLQGHGFCRRGVRGPLSLADAPASGVQEVWCRRYRCTACKHVTVVRPAGLGAKLHFSRVAIALAFVLWTHNQLPAWEVRDRLVGQASHGNDDPKRWRSLSRWAGRHVLGERGSVVGQDGRDYRKVVSRWVEALAGYAPMASREAPFAVRVLLGTEQLM